MSHKITSEDNWLVQCLFLASFGAALFFSVSNGWLAAQLGVTHASASVYSATMAVAPAAPVLVYETNATMAEKKSSYKASSEAGVAHIVVSGVREGQTVTGMLYVTVLPKYLSDVSKIELRLNGVVQAPKESTSATYAINTASLPEGTHTIVVDVRGVTGGEDISLQKNVTFKVDRSVAETKKPTTKDTNSTYEKPSASGVMPLKLGYLFRTTDRINVRSEPNGAIIAQQNAGVRATQVAEAVIPQANYDWVLVEFPGGLKGYVAADFLRSESGAAGSSKAPDATMANVQALQAQVAALQAQLADIQAQLNALLE